MKYYLAFNYWLPSENSWEMKILVVALINYAIAMTIEDALKSHPNPNYKKFARNIRLLLGYMAIVILVLINVLIYGVLLLSLWVYMVIRVARNPYQDLYLLVGEDLQHSKELAEDAIQRLFGRLE
ncbi:hypothetical protein P3X46_022525 [Hevea brasiliensis]|uniref:PRA1 family protein n=1 Tax=Hevea brasiliensis TaxID=3981 RepID=A0ABQ9LBK6_HEVBR|nr:hypothetical protein P3X46_022525 [Hevea brasiliensis]